MQQAPPSPSTSAAGPTRTRRITRACDRCHASNTRCSRGPNPSQCGSCFEFGERCTYDRPVKRRGPAVGSHRKGRKPPSLGGSRRQDSISFSHRGWEEESESAGGTPWVYRPVSTAEDIERLAESYGMIAYPIFPLFHWPSFMRDVRERRYTVERDFYVVVMAVCAIVSARLRHGVEMPQASHPPLGPSPSSPSSGTFYHLAIDAFPSSLTTPFANTFNYKRAKALLAIACVQYGDTASLNLHLGDYVTLSHADGFYDETRWPADLKEPEIQERRRLFWSTYTLEIFTAITWGGLVRHRQSQCNVLYPAEVLDDNDITDAGSFVRGRDESFLRGWNFTTDLYKVLEHLVDRLRSRRFRGGGMTIASPVESLFNASSPFEPSSQSVNSMVDEMHNGLPPVFKVVQAMTGTPEIDRFGFQAANVIVTLQTVKMILAGIEESSIEQRCSIAGQLLDALAAIPTAYIASISAPMLHHLASVGHLLAGVIQHPLSQWSFLQVRNVLQALADLISGLEAVLSISSDISMRLTSHVSTIDDKMRFSAARAAHSQVYHNALPKHQAGSPSDSQTSDIASSIPTGVPATDIRSASGSTTIDDSFSQQALAPDWSYEFSPDQQTQLQNDLTANWPFDMGPGGILDSNFNDFFTFMPVPVEGDAGTGQMGDQVTTSSQP